MVTDLRSVLALEQFTLPHGWSWQWLSDVMDIEGGAQPPASTFLNYLAPGYIRFIQIRDFGGDSHLTYIEELPKWRKCSPRDVLIARYGVSLGRILRGLEGAYNVALVKAVPKEVDVDFLYYLLQSKFFQDPLAGIGARSVQSGFNKADLRVIPVPIPPPSEQRAIADLLGSLDDKIELNRRMNETLEAMARAIFKSWFVDAAQAGLPKGWREGKVEELLTLSRETINPSDFPHETFDHYSIPAFDEGRLPKAEAGAQIQSNKFLVPPNAVMISKLNPRISRGWLPNVSAKDRSVASTEFLVAIPNPGISREWLYALFSSKAFLDVFATLVTGTSGSHQRVKPEYLLTIDLEIPPKERIAEYTALAKPLHEHFALNLGESRTLAALRNALLSKLLSGEIRVKDAAKFVESQR